MWQYFVAHLVYYREERAAWEFPRAGCRQHRTFSSEILLRCNHTNPAWLCQTALVRTAVFCCKLGQEVKSHLWSLVPLSWHDMAASETLTALSGRSCDLLGGSQWGKVPPCSSPVRSQAAESNSTSVRYAWGQSSFQLMLTPGVPEKALGCGRSGRTASVGTCRHVGHGQPVALLQVSVSWALACGVCQEKGLGFIIYHYQIKGN